MREAQARNNNSTGTFVYLLLHLFFNRIADMKVAALIDRLARWAGVSGIYLLAACSTTSQESPDHPEYFDPVLEKATGFGGDRVMEAFHYLDSVYAAFPDAGPLDRTRKYNFKLDYYWNIRRDPYRARIYADSILWVLSGKTTQPAYAIEYGRALLQIGDLLKEEGKYSDAFSRYYEGRAFIQRAGDTCFFNEYNSRLAVTYYYQNRFQEAIPYFREAFAVLDACKRNLFYRFRNQQADLDNIALCYHKLGQTDSAMFYYDSATRYIAAHKAPFLKNPPQARFVGEALAVINGNKGSLLLKMGDTAGAENLYRQSIATNLYGSETRDAQITITKLVTLHLAQRRHSEAATWLGVMRRSLDTMPNGENETLWHKLRSQYHQATGNHAMALLSLQSYIRVKDSLEKTSSPLRAIDIQKEFGYLAREYELTLLRRENEVKTTYLYISLIFFAMTIAIILLIWQNWKRSKKHVEELRKLNHQILIQHDQMNKSLDALEQSQLDNSKMMKIVAHDLRNPVGAIITLTELIWLKDNDQSGETQSLLGMMKESGEKALNLITELLRMNVISKTQMELVQIDLVLQYCVDLLRLKAEEKDQKIVLHTIPMTLQASREKIWRVFSNLITNAVKFSRRGTVIEVSMKRDNNLLRISVKDNGIGIPTDMKDKIFSMSPGAGRKGTQGEESYGLGLAISKQIVESHGGRIWFESQEGKGSVFHVELRINALN
ncbi:GHKL domain-containing protein [Chitinophaga lutea]|uniref:histidine kinase n=2 Tax=Chitinophaga lutea TaxID=2488634 RepID=A0A3N4PLZ0_9BACT|nr:GHKL domain-containing protein [Chitinophaga lutea]